MADYGQQDYDHHRQMTVGYVFQDFNLLEGPLKYFFQMTPLTFDDNVTILS